MKQDVAGQDLARRVVLAQEKDFILGQMTVKPSSLEVSVAPESPRTLEPRVMQVLVALGREPGRAISRDELVERCWEGRSVGDDAITRCIGALRKLGRDLGDPFEIETLSKIGYRLVLRGVSAKSEAEPGTAAKEDAADRSIEAKGLRGFRPTRRLIAGFAAIALAAVLALAALWMQVPRTPASGGRVQESAERAEAARLTQAARALMYLRNSTSFAQAEDLLRKAVATDPTYAPAWSRLGLAIWYPWWVKTQKDPNATKEKLKAEAIGYVKRALALSPNSAEAHGVMGDILNDSNEGLSWLERSIELDANDPEVWMWLGEARRDESHDLRGALAAFERARSLDPAWHQLDAPYLNLVFRLRGGPEAYREIERIAVSINDQSTLLRMKADIHLAEGRLGDTAALAAGVLRAHPQTYWAQERLVRIALVLGDKALADRILASSPLLQSQYEPVVAPQSVNARAVADPDGWWDGLLLGVRATQLVTEGRSSLLVDLYDRRFKSPSDFVVHCSCSSLGALGPGTALVVALRKAGRSAEADQILAALTQWNARYEAAGDLSAQTSVIGAQLAALSGNTRLALDRLHEAIGRGWRGQLLDAGVVPAKHPAFESLKDKPEFQTVLARLDEARRAEAERVAKVDLAGVL